MIEKSSIFHKDKVCDYIANSVQYYYTKNDFNSIVSVDVVYTSGSYEILGQVSSSFSQSNDTELKLHVASDLDKPADEATDAIRSFLFTLNSFSMIYSKYSLVSYSSQPVLIKIPSFKGNLNYFPRKAGLMCCFRLILFSI